MLCSVVVWVLECRFCLCWKEWVCLITRSTFIARTWLLCMRFSADPPVPIPAFTNKLIFQKENLFFFLFFCFLHTMDFFCKFTWIDIIFQPGSISLKKKKLFQWCCSSAPNLTGQSISLWNHFPVWLLLLLFDFEEREFLCGLSHCFTTHPSFK